jgi:hypothetical protein
MSGTLDAAPTGLTATAGFDFIVLQWTNPSLFDGYIEIRRSDNSSWASGVLIATISGSTYWDMIGSYGVQKWYWIRAKSTKGGYSAWVPSSAGAGATATTTQIATSDIETFAITASQIYTRIPIITGDVWKDNYPSAGYVDWNACTVVYNGASNSITGDSTNLKYIYWKAPRSGTAYGTVHTTDTTLSDTRLLMTVNQYVGNIITCNGKTMTIASNNATTFTGASWSGGNNPGDHYAWSLNTGTVFYKSATHPAATMGDTDFIIAVNISGVHDLAWNAIANQVIGSAWIQNAAIKTALIEDLAVTTALIADAAINTAKITDLNVTTIKIGNNAVTIPVSAYTAGYVACAEDVYTTIQSCSITSTGAPIFCTWSFQVINDSASPNYMMFVMVDEHDSVKHSATVTFPGSASMWFCFNVTTTPAAEAKTYNVKVIPYDGTASVYSRSMMILECKK